MCAVHTFTHTPDDSQGDEQPNSEHCWIQQCVHHNTGCLKESKQSKGSWEASEHCNTRARQTWCVCSQLKTTDWVRESQGKCCLSKALGDRGIAVAAKLSLPFCNVCITWHHWILWCTAKVTHVQHAWLSKQHITLLEIWVCEVHNLPNYKGPQNSVDSSYKLSRKYNTFFHTSKIQLSNLWR